MSGLKTEYHLLRVTPLTYILVIALALVVAVYYWPGREASRNAARDQAAIETMVRETNDHAAYVQKIRDETRDLLDPLQELLEIDRHLQGEGLPPQTAKDFVADLT